MFFELGMITGVSLDGDSVHVRMIPTFSACPAVEIIRRNIRTTLEKESHTNVTVEIDKETNWHSNRITEAAKEEVKTTRHRPSQAS